MYVFILVVYSSIFSISTVTVTLQVAVKSPTVATICVEPALYPVTFPSLSTSAILGFNDFHTTSLLSVVSYLGFSALYVTLSFCGLLLVIFILLGNDILLSGFSTVTFTLSCTIPNVAVIVAFPGPTAVIVPSLPTVHTPSSVVVNLTLSGVIKE